MPVVETAFARAFAENWLEAWNAHDLDRVLDHYTADVEFSSPMVVSIAGETSGVLEGKHALRAYWTKGLAMIPDLRFELIDVLSGIDCVTLYYRGHRGTVAEAFHLAASGKVRFSTSSYSVGA